MKVFAAHGLAALAILLSSTVPTSARPVPAIEQQNTDPDVMCLVAITLLVSVMKSPDTDPKEARDWLPRLSYFVIFYRGKTYERLPKERLQAAMGTALADLRALPSDQSTKFLDQCINTAAEALEPVPMPAENGAKH